MIATTCPRRCFSTLDNIAIFNGPIVYSTIYSDMAKHTIKGKKEFEAQPSSIMGKPRTKHNAENCILLSIVSCAISSSVVAPVSFFLASTLLSFITDPTMEAITPLKIGMDP